MLTGLQNAEDDPVTIYFGAAVVAHGRALMVAMVEIAKIKGVDDLQWFDDMSSVMILAAKERTPEKIPEEVEASAIRFGAQLLETHLNEIRDSLAKV